MSLITPTKIFYDKIRKIEIAADFNKKTFEGNRNDMCKEAFRMWARKTLKGIVKPEFFIMVSSNISELPDTEEMKKNFGKMIDEMLILVESEGPSLERSQKIDEITKKHLPSLFR